MCGFSWILRTAQDDGTEEDPSFSRFLISKLQGFKIPGLVLTV
jgi:hypothetical protein